MPIWLSPPVTTQEMADLVQSIKHKRKLRVDYSMLLTPTGTGLYQAGEVVTGHDYTEKVDIWSAGMTVLYMICGADVARPQGRIRNHVRTHTKSVKTLSPECMDLLEEMLQPNPVARASALQCYTHRWFTCDIARSKRRGRLQTCRTSTLRDEQKNMSRGRGSRSKRVSAESRGVGERSQSAPPCPTARLQLMWFETLAMRQTYVVKMKREKATHQELIVSLSQNIIAYPADGDGKPIVVEPLPSGSEVAAPSSAAKNWRTPPSSSDLLALEDEKPKEAKRSACTCCRRRSAKVAIQDRDPPDVVLDVSEDGFPLDVVPGLNVVPAQREVNKDPSNLSRSGSSDVAKRNSDRESSDLAKRNSDRESTSRRSDRGNDDKASKVSDNESSKTKNSKNSRNTQMTGDSKKYIQTCSWMFRDETDSFAIRLPEGATEAPFTLNLSDIAVREGPFAGLTQDPAAVENGSSGHGRAERGPSESGSRAKRPSAFCALSEASLSHVAGSETNLTSGSRTALSQAATNLIKNGNLRELFNMIWSARGFRRKFSRECPF